MSPARRASARAAALPSQVTTRRAPLLCKRRWQIELGNSLTLLGQLPDASVDAIVTDPPYSSGGAFRGDRLDLPSRKYVTTGQALRRAEFSGDNRDQRGYLAWSTVWLAECLRVAKVGAPICLFTDWRQMPITTDALQAGGWVWRGVVPWDKTEQVRPQRGRFRAQAEFVIWGSSGPMPLNRPVAVLPGAYRVPVNLREKKHLTGKPVDLLRQIVRICEPGGIVLDPFAGSGSTGVAALLEGYRFLGFELSPYYAGIAKEWLADAERRPASRAA